MKRRIIGGLIILSLVFAGTAVWAEEGTEGKAGPEVEAGVKLWMNKRKTEVPGAETVTSNSVVLAGPAVEAKFENNLYVEAAYLASLSDYKMAEAAGTIESKRHDLDLAVGYLLPHEIGVFAGYRTSELKDDAGKETLSGPVLGVRGAAPVAEALSLYGQFTYQLTKLKTDDAAGSASEDAPGWIAELGVKYEVVRHLAANLGYMIETNKGKDSDIKDTFSGVTLGAMYAF